MSDHTVAWQYASSARSVCKVKASAEIVGGPLSRQWCRISVYKRLTLARKLLCHFHCVTNTVPHIWWLTAVQLISPSPSMLADWPKQNPKFPRQINVSLRWSICSYHADVGSRVWKKGAETFWLTADCPFPDWLIRYQVQLSSASNHYCTDPGSESRQDACFCFYLGPWVRLAKLLSLILLIGRCTYQVSWSNKSFGVRF